MKITMMLLREILRLILTTDYSSRKIARLSGVSPNTVGFYRRLVKEKNLVTDQIKAMDDSELILQFHGSKKSEGSKVFPNFDEVHERIQKNKYLTLEMVHEEYKNAHKERAYCKKHGDMHCQKKTSDFSAVNFSC